MSLKYNPFNRFYFQPNAGAVSVPDGSITSAKLAANSVTTSKLDVVFPLIGFAGSDETSNLTVGNNKIKTIAPIAIQITKIKAYVTTAPVGSSIAISLKKNGVEFANITIIAGSNLTSVTSTATLAEDDVISLDVTAIGSTTAGAGLKVYINGKPV